MALTVWKMSTKRFGPVGGFAVAVVIAAGYMYLKPWFSENAPDIAGTAE